MTTIRYVFKDGPVCIKGMKDADPQRIGEALLSIAQSAGGDLEPKAVVDAARSPSSVLHRHFDWDDEVAAEKWRVEQARDLIACLVSYPLGGNAEPARAFHSIATADGRAYHALDEIRTSADLQERLLAEAERDLLAFQTRYRALKDICALVEPAKKAIRAKRAKNETRAAA